MIVLGRGCKGREKKRGMGDVGRREGVVLWSEKMRVKNSFVVVSPLGTAVYFMLEIISKILKNKYAGPLD